MIISLQFQRARSLPPERFQFTVTWLEKLSVHLLQSYARSSTYTTGAGAALYSTCLRIGPGSGYVEYEWPTCNVTVRLQFPRFVSLGDTSVHLTPGWATRNIATTPSVVCMCLPHHHTTCTTASRCTRPYGGYYYYKGSGGDKFIMAPIEI